MGKQLVGQSILLALQRDHIITIELGLTYLSVSVDSHLVYPVSPGMMGRSEGVSDPLDDVGTVTVWNTKFWRTLLVT